ncbi:ferredoxin--NADP reductase [Pinibacter aurantiacus]|uniref:Ferredoxin--NADP reductase n=1 Tax=Pinibacter aurantiacus TaxID=2851599 RepID=A0A9E2W8E2_9BACT|nr:ferredoxin--NADP reductase [Pinibacter aurantiacus]MBV4358037.1 ferredoxin--NADP reductase [Pinibacter aurantiacus]
MTTPYIHLKITNIIEETSQSKTFVVAPLAEKQITYKAGQFLTFVFSKHDMEERRSFSISSTPLLNEPLSITVKRLDNGEYSRKLIDNTSVGDELVTIGASGFFTLPDDISAFRQIFFFAAGSGITPVLPLIKTLLHSNTDLKMVLIYSNRSVADTIFYKALQELASKFPNKFTIEFLFSDAKNLGRARLSKWLLNVLLKEYSTCPYHQTLFYLCGPFDYMRMATIQLLAEGVPGPNIHKENFTTFKVETKELPPDTLPHMITIEANGNVYDLVSQYPQTILQAAKKADITLPYSCEAGRCGTCSATCISGKVWMSYNEVLMDDEIAKGRVLTCVGYPVGGDVILKF